MKKRFVTDVKIVVEIPDNMFATNRDRIVALKRSTAADTISQIRRHVDGIQHMEIVEDVEYQCEHCGSDWTEDSDTYNGGCCDADEANNPKPEVTP
jgi:transposase-like protein